MSEEAIPARTQGPPASANGASSSHLWWELPPGPPLVEVAAVLQVRVLPAVERLYFWALQASFHNGAAEVGGAHLGLQWCPEGTPGRFANWGGYDAGGAVLAGSQSRLPSRTGNPNTRDYPWVELRSYRLRIHRGSPEAWRGEIVDLGTGTATVIRDLFASAPHVSRPVVWSEVFADCDAPSVVVRWSQMTARTAAGRGIRTEAVRAGYQSRAEGGCDNTTALADGAGVLQVTNARRTVPPGGRLRLR